MNIAAKDLLGAVPVDITTPTGHAGDPLEDKLVQVRDLLRRGLTHAAMEHLTWTLDTHFKCWRC